VHKTLSFVWRVFAKTSHSIMPATLQNSALGRCGSACEQSPHRPGISRTLGLRARSSSRTKPSNLLLTLDGQATPLIVVEQYPP